MESEEQHYGVKAMRWGKPHEKMHDDDPENIVWARPFRFEQCVARMESNARGYWGRCERKRLHHGPHALDRGMDIVLFVTEWVD